MSLKFRRIGVDVIDHEHRITPEDEWVWTKVKLVFEDAEERFPGVTIAVPAGNDESQSLGAFREGAVDAARLVLKAALDALEAGSYSSLVQDHRAIELPVYEASMAAVAEFEGVKTTFDGGTTTFDGGKTSLD